MQNIVGRTEKVRTIRKLLDSGKMVYLASFFLGGKTVLMEQTASSIKRTVLRYNAEKEDWYAFSEEARQHPDALLLIDNIHWLTLGPEEESFRTFLEDHPKGQGIIMAGRAQRPECFQRYIINGELAVLGIGFMLFSEEEIEQLFLYYDIKLSPADATWLKKRTMGWVFPLNSFAQRMSTDPNATMDSVEPEIALLQQRTFTREAIAALPEEYRTALYNLCPFPEFSADMARMLTGRTDMPRILQSIVQNTFMLQNDQPEQFRFIPFVQKALFSEMQNQYTKDYITGQYKRAALYFELTNENSKAISYYVMLNDTEKVRELLIRDTRSRPSNGDYVEMREAYALLPEKMILESPELMKGMCLVESLMGRAEQSERWYSELKSFMSRTNPRVEEYAAAEEALLYLDVSLPHRGSSDLLRNLVKISKQNRMTRSGSWREGFNIAGNSVSLLNGGKDFSRWVPHGWTIYRVASRPIEAAIGLGGAGLSEIAIGECELESNLNGDYEKALNHILLGMTRIAFDLEIRCAVKGIQSRLITAEGDISSAIRLMDHLLESLPDYAPKRLKENMRVHRLTLLLMSGETREALSWLETEAPDEVDNFVILDRYKYMLKLRLYIITGQWHRTRLLTARLRQYFEQYDRPYMRAQLHFLQSIIERRQGSENWHVEAEAGLALAKRYCLARLVADEGAGIVDILADLKLPKESWEESVLLLTRQQASYYPLYMKSSGNRPVFTEREQQVYTMIAAGYKNAQISSILGIAERTVKYYASEVYRKLGVTTRAEAIRKAAELGDTNQ